MSLNPDKYLKVLYQDHLPKYTFASKSKEEWSNWREDLKEALIEALGGITVEDNTPLKAEISEEVEYDSYLRQRVVFNINDYLKTSAYLLIPKDKRKEYPAIVACHGHGYGSKEVVGLTPAGLENQKPTCHNNFALDLVKKGFLVIAPEIIGFGERRLAEDNHSTPTENSCYQLATYLLMFGKTLAGMRVIDISRSIDYLLSRNDVASQRIGCMGFSGGGMVAALASALDERIRVAVISGYTNTFKDSIMSTEHCLDNYIPGILKYAELADIIGMIAPRPLLIQAGLTDNIFPIDGVLTAYQRIKEVYQCLDIEDKVAKDIIDKGHEVATDKPCEWFKRWL
ncbi:cephalosporin-C deacetylase-like acetyl esterase [Orenia metallireducens]|jgi:dienelactone hydrolase|uniref:Cephalosporin-C deacetylase n=1 Tax=Orenia metallireducens TaxID=1413210 RepID=A0A285G7P2_9FIRM|nr:alpha/beta hydrolase family protein [Orenia metallireducens]PRX24177.1 cephalosporin-C deacetylase-like acetyl esterase [Orenia metallireducens]SNY19592.1 Cephalosporin-C deacetylase [Orenia metallireducens]